jgi:hypothetical protein
MTTATVWRISGQPLTEVIDPGDPYVSNFYPTVDLDAPKAPLWLGIGDESGLLQLMDPYERPSLYEHYWYRSGTNETAWGILTARRELLRGEGRPVE